MIATETIPQNSESRSELESGLKPAVDRRVVSLWLVDDNEMLREVLADNFNLEANIDCARQFPSAEALLATLARETPPEVILLDINMRGMSGIEALPSIKALAPSTRVLML